MLLFYVVLGLGMVDFLVCVWFVWVWVEFVVGGGCGWLDVGGLGVYWCWIYLVCVGVFDFCWVCCECDVYVCDCCLEWLFGCNGDCWLVVVVGVDDCIDD